MAIQESEAADYDDAVLFILAYEFSPAERGETDAKIRKKLKTASLGEYDEERIERLRRFKDEIQTEIHKGPRSMYYTQAHSKYSEHRDFDGDRMAAKFAESFPEVPRQSIQKFVEYAIYLYYLR